VVEICTKGKILENDIKHQRSALMKYTGYMRRMCGFKIAKERKFFGKKGGD
jgi:hypothetical protein